jgi:hypothetical protein
MWSPQAGFLVLPLILAAAWPVVRNHPAVADLAASERGDFASVIWGESVSFAVVLGFLTGLMTRDLLHAPFAFVIPSLRERVLAGRALLGLLVAGFLAWKIFPVAGVEIAAAIVSCTLLFFSVGTAMSDPIFPRTGLWVIGALLVVPMWEPDHVRRFYESAPIICTLSALAITIVLARREIDADITRARILRPPPRRRAFADVAGSPLFGSSGRLQAWRGRPFTGALGDWVRAVHYENFGVGRFAWPVSVFWAVALNCMAAYFLKNPSFAAVMGLMNLSMGGHRITGRWAYPIARDRRALVLWMCSLGDSVAYFTLALLALPLVYALDLPQVDIVRGVIPRYGLLAPLGVAFIIAPIVQWPRITSNLAPAQIMKFGPLWLRVSFRFVAAITLMTVLLEVLFLVREQLSLASAFAVGAFLVLAFQRYYWVNLRHHFAGSDLA